MHRDLNGNTITEWHKPGLSCGHLHINIWKTLPTLMHIHSLNKHPSIAQSWAVLLIHCSVSLTHPHMHTHTNADIQTHKAKLSQAVNSSIKVCTFKHGKTIDTVSKGLTQLQKQPFKTLHCVLVRTFTLCINYYRQGWELMGDKKAVLLVATWA